MKICVPIIYIVALAISTSAYGEVDLSNIDTNYVRPAAVAGGFYPGSPSELAKTLAEFFHAAPKPQLAGKPFAIIAPHAGYIYSGAIAAKAYKVLEGEEYNSVIVISPSHTTYFKGVSVFGGKAYSTPLGEIPIDQELAKKIASFGGLISLSDKGHINSGARSEHALEVQLPFLQMTLGKFNLVAIVMGDQDQATCNALAQAIANAVGGRDDVLIVASSDLSHFHDRITAALLDSVIAEDIEKYNFKKLTDDLETQKTEACGGGPIIAALMAAQRMGADSAKITGLGDSSDANGDKDSVVGYLSAVVYKSGDDKVIEIELEEEGNSSKAGEKSDSVSNPATTSGADFGLGPDDKNLLLSIARKSIQTRLEGKEITFPKDMPASLKSAIGCICDSSRGR